MGRKWFSQIKKCDPRVIALAVVLAVPLFSFQNCSDPQFASIDASGKLAVPSGTFTINDGAIYTNNVGVTAKIAALNSVEMAIANQVCPEENGPFEPLRDVVPWILENREGTAPVYLRLRDENGQVSPCIEASIILDMKAPTVEILSGAEKLSVKKDAAFAVKAQDEISGVDKIYCRFPDATDFSECKMVFNLTNLKEGGQAVVVYSTDKAGNRSEPVEYSFFVDTMAPVVALKAPYPPAVSTMNAVSIHFEGDDGAAGSGIDRYVCALNNVEIANCSSPMALSDLADGDYTFAVRAIDKAGHMSAVVEAKFKVDTRPSGEFQILGVTGGTDVKIDNYLSALAAPKLHWSASAGAEYYVVAIYDAANVNVVCAPATVNSADLTYQFNESCMLMDGASYTARASAYRNQLEQPAAAYAFAVDASAPVITILNVAKDDEKKTAKIDFTVTDAVSGVKSVLCYKKFKDDLRMDDCLNRNSIEYAGLAEGEHEFYIVAGDQLDHTAQSQPTKFQMQYVVCDPFKLNEGKCQKGLKANLYYASAEDRQLGNTKLNQKFNSVGKLFTEGLKSNAIIYLPFLDVRARDFTEGFSTTDNGKLKDDAGNVLDEWFALDMETVIKLGDGDEEGYYQFILVADDGANLKIKGNVNDAEYTTLIDNDGIHSTRVGCHESGNGAVQMTRATRIPAKIEYYQGPRTRIAASLFWRKVKNANSSSSKYCGNTDQGPASTYTNLINDGFKPLNAQNFILNEAAPAPSQ